ncbi:flagellar filament capping protein FliD [Desulfocurvus sp. DL9XJH121]
MADYTSGAIYFTGLGSETDFDSIIKAMVETESVRLNQLEDWEEYWQEKSDALAELNTELGTLRSTLAGMDTVAEFSEKSAASTKENALTVRTDGDAEDGTHTITVGQLAQNDIWTSSVSVSDLTSAITTSNATFTFSYAGEQYSVALSANASLQDLVDAINSNPDSKADVRAATINDGTGHHLQIYGMDMGAANAITIDASTLTGLSASDFDNTQAAQSARIKVDGFPLAADEWIERNTNTISDVIKGVTLDLHDEATDITITIGTDTDAIKEKIVDLVEAINSVLIKIQDLTSVKVESETKATGSLMTGNYGVDMVKSNIKNITASAALGFEYYDADTGLGDLYSALSQIGIATDPDESSETFGQLIIDEGELDEALDTDAQAVIDLFACTEDGTTDSTDMTYVSSVEGITKGGDHKVEYEVVGGQIVWATVNGEEALVSDNLITGQYGNSGAGLAVRVNNLADGTYSGTVSVKQGKIGQLADMLADMTDSEDGILVIIGENYDSIVANTQESIDQEEDRLTLYEDRLRERFATLEKVLTELKAINTSLETTLKSLNSD